jgi:hypothetical protein
MAITLDTAAQFEALGLAIFNANVQPNEPSQAGLGAHYDPAFFTGIRGHDDAIDAQYLALIAPVMLAIDGRTMATGFDYTLNVTNALQGRPKHWFIEGLYEFVPGDAPPCSVGFMYFPAPGTPGFVGDIGSYGFTIATAMCAGICNVWANIIRRWLAGNYPYAVNPAPQ